MQPLRGQLLAAVEGASSDAPWQRPERFHRSNALLRFSVSDGPEAWSLTGMAYRAGWWATDQVPQRAIDSGVLDRFGTLDPSDGGGTARASLSWNWQRPVRGGQWQASAYALRSRLDLYSNFTGLLARPGGDQFAQAGEAVGPGRAVGREHAQAQAVGGVDRRGDLGHACGRHEDPQGASPASIESGFGRHRRHSAVDRRRTLCPWTEASV